MSDALDLFRLTELAQKATPGPWQAVHRQHGKRPRSFIHRRDSPGKIQIAALWDYIAGNEECLADAEFIAACSPDVILHLVQLAAETQQIREERDAAASKLLVEAVREQNDLRAHRDELLDRTERLQRAVDWEIENRRGYQQKVLQAEAETQALREALEDMLAVSGDPNAVTGEFDTAAGRALRVLQRLTPASPRTGEIKCRECGTLSDREYCSEKCHETAMHDAKHPEF